MAIKTTKILVLILTLLSCVIASARSHWGVFIEGSQSYTTFKFVANNASDYHGFTHKADRELCAGYLCYWKYGIILGGDVGLYNGGATEMLGNEDYSWDLKYIRTKISVGYLIDKWPVKPFVSVSPYYGYLLKGTESIGAAEYDLKRGNQISCSDLGIVTTGGVKVKLAHALQIFGAYNQNLGLLNIETHPGQKQYNRGYSFSVGVVVKLPERE